MPHYDVAVCGLGIMGAAALHRLARAGKRVLGIERFSPGHDYGSSHGDTRIIRLSYFEHSSYVPLLQRAYALWREIENSTGRPLLRITGIAEIGPPDGAVVAGTLASCRLHGLPHEMLTAAAVMGRFPALRLPADFIGVVQPDGGYLAAEPSTHAMIELARAAGAEIRCGERIRSIEPCGNGVRIVTDHDTIEAGAAVVAAGPWMKSLLPSLLARLRVTRQVMAWFVPADPAPFAPGAFPVFLLESRHGIHYGFPPDGSGRVKIAKHHHADETANPEAVDRTVSAADLALIRAALAEHIPAANGDLAAAATCLYTVTPDGDFIIDRLPGAPQIIVASPCSGHGFKFAPVVGEIAADLATTGESRHDISRFTLARFR